MKLISKKLCIINNCDVWVRYFWINTALTLKITFCQKILSSLIKCYCCSIAHLKTNQSFSKYNCFHWVVHYIVIIEFIEEIKKHAMVTVLSFTTQSGFYQSVSDRLQISNEMFSVESNDPKRCLVCTEFSLSSSFPAIHL